MRTRKTAVAAVPVAVVAGLSAPALASADGRHGHNTDHRGQALTAIGLTADQGLVEFTVDRPAKTMTIGKVSGLRGDTKVVGIDFRVQNERLYGVGDKGGIYTLNTEASP
ncbi:DUF4394 domain-containing protein [Streptomyces finlayi]|uniref:DUF4394 domain-containing protein n=1 Tax=Streptomyces finlayi TaxID=67296 RepID=A0A7G7BQF7_9ACTN|nr:DUF4394 domain-containing protein [Streptomyces finlayi]